MARFLTLEVSSFLHWIRDSAIISTSKISRLTEGDGAVNKKTEAQTLMNEIKNKFCLMKSFWTAACLLMLVVACNVVFAKPAQALDSDFSNGITVDSVVDGNDASIGNGICNDGSGNCTFRAAIQEANAHVGADTITFSISGTGQHDIVLSDLGTITITGQVFINGYSQSGSSDNSTTAPNALDMEPTIGIDLTNIPSVLPIQIQSGAANSVIQGLAIHGSANLQAYVVVEADHISFYGNKFGVDLDGVADKLISIFSGTSAAHHISIGGPSPEQRNIFNGVVLVQSSAGGNYDIEGNYFGVDESGVGDLGLGGVNFINDSGTDNSRLVDNVIGNCDSDDNCVAFQGDNTTISGNLVGTYADGSALTSGTTVNSMILGGSVVTVENNLVAGFNSCGIYLSGDTGTIQGNYVGVDLAGTVALASGGNGLCIENADGLQIGGSGAGEGNVISGVGTGLSGFAAIDIRTSNDVNLQGNLIGTAASGLSAISNTGYGVGIRSSSTIQIGGSGAGEGNVISGNDNGGINVIDSSALTVQGNVIGLGSDLSTQIPNLFGIIGSNVTSSLIGGLNAGEGNLISANDGNGVGLESVSSVAILGNSIYDNDDLGIDLLNDNQVNSNDNSDSDSGPNNNLNYPTNLYFEENGGNTDMTFDLDVPAGDYRVEFFENTAVDGSGFGEGQTFLGYEDITSAGSGSEQFASQLTGDGYSYITTTVTAADVSGPQGYSITSEFSAAATPQPISTDLEISKTLDNPEDIEVGGELHYTIVVSNNGDDPVDLAGFDGNPFNPFASNLFIDMLPSDLTYDALSGSSNSDIACTDTGTTIGQLLASNHTDSHFITCAYDGSGQTLTAGQSISTTITVTVNNDSDLTFTNYAITGSVTDDPDTTAILSALNDSFSGGGTPDFIDSLITLNPNNFTAVGPFTDVSVQNVLTDPEDVVPGSTVSYQASIAIKGPQGIDLREYGFPTTLLAFIYPGNDLTYVSTDNVDVQCTDLGPGSINYLGSFGEDHPAHQLVVCSYSGASQPILVDETFSFKLNFLVKPGVAATFTSYALHTATLSDPDMPTLSAAFGAVSDQLDTFENENFARAVFTSSASGGGSTSTSNSTSSTLPGTGENVSKYLVLAGGLLTIPVLGSIIFAKRRSRQ